MSTGISGSKTVFTTSTTFGCNSAVTARSIDPICGASPVGSGGGAVSASTFQASGGVNGVCDPLDGASADACGVPFVAAGASAPDGALGGGAVTGSSFLPPKNEKIP